MALCTDYDGTLAHDGVVDPRTIAAIERFLAAGRRVVLVTGRQLEELGGVCPRLDLFDRVVAENGGILHRPRTGTTERLAEPVPLRFVEALRARGIVPAVGRVLVATWEPHEGAVLDTIRDLGLELQVIFNKGAVMILPPGVNKATGLARALEEMSLVPETTVGVGDAENDHALLSFCGLGAAVANALPSLKAQADIVTLASHGDGVVELIDHVLAEERAAS